MQRDLKHYTAPSFWNCYYKLPSAIQALADKNFRILKSNLQHPSLHLKTVDRYYSARVGRRYRTLAVETEAGLIWFWIGTHSEYDKMIG
jgi:hypothetical protein